MNHILMEPPAQIRIVQSGLFDSTNRALTTFVPTTNAPAPAPAPPPASKPKAVRKKKEVSAPAPAPAPASAPAPAQLPESKPKVKAPRKKKNEVSASASAPAQVAPVSQPAVASAAPASAPPAPAKKKAKFEKGSQEAKDYMAAIRAKRKQTAVEKAGETPAHSEADDAVVIKKTSRKKKADKEMLA